jgi:hypothetical protein
MINPQGIKIKYSVEVDVPEGVFAGAGVQGLQQLMSSVTNNNHAAQLPQVTEYRQPQHVLPQRQPQLALPPAPQTYQPPTFTAYSQPCELVLEPPAFEQVTQASPRIYHSRIHLIKAALRGLSLGTFILVVALVALNKDNIISFVEEPTIKSTNASTEEIKPATADTAVPPNNAAGTAPPGFNKNNLFQPALGQ